MREIFWSSSVVYHLASNTQKRQNLITLDIDLCKYTDISSHSQAHREKSIIKNVTTWNGSGLTHLASVIFGVWIDNGNYINDL